MGFKLLEALKKGQKCHLCLTNIVDTDALGDIYETTGGIIVHYFCLLLASKIQQRGSDKQGLLGFFTKDIKKEIKRGSTITCDYCKKNGATVKCSKDNCHLNFHVPCAQQKGSLHQFFNQFKSFCGKHKPRQKIPASLKKRKDLECVLCCSPIKFNVKSQEDDPLWPTCCKPKTLLHKRCLQHLARSSGYYFKCPYCNNKTEFNEGMKTYGIYIPEIEATWEREANAYRELLERDIKCDAGRCRCPNGRGCSINNSKWFLEVCLYCGASGCHRGCMLENIPTGTFECDVCAKVNTRFSGPVDVDDLPESSPLSNNGQSNGTVQQSVEGNISKIPTMDCDEIVVISDSEGEDSEVEVIDVIPPPTVITNLRKRQLPILQKRQSGIKRQRLAEGGAATSEMSFTIDEENESPLSQAMDNPSSRTDELANNQQTCETNSPNRETINEPESLPIDNIPSTEDSSALLIAKVCTLSDINQSEIFQFTCYENSNTNEVHSNQNVIGYIDLESDNQNEDEVFVISDTDSDSNASSLLDSDGSLLDLSEIPESEKSLLLQNFSPPHFIDELDDVDESERTQTPKRRRRKKNSFTHVKRKKSVSATPCLKSNANKRSDEIINGKEVNPSSDQTIGNIESASSEIANANISSSVMTNCDSSEDESFRGFCLEQTLSNDESVENSIQNHDEGSLPKNKTSSIEKEVNAAEPISVNHKNLSSIGDADKCMASNKLDSVMNIKSQVIDLDKNDQLSECAGDNNTVKTISNSVVLKLLPQDCEGYNSVSNVSEPSKCENSNCTVTVISHEDSCLNESTVGTEACNSDPSELSRSIQNFGESNFNSETHKVIEAPDQVIKANYVSNYSNFLNKECSLEKVSKKSLKIKTKPIIKESNKLIRSYKTKRPIKNKGKLKILCSLVLDQIVGKVNNPNQAKNDKSSNDIHSKIDLLPVSHDSGINFSPPFSSYQISPNEVDLRMSDIPLMQSFNVSYNTIEDLQSPESIELELELHSLKNGTEISLEPCSSGNCATETNGELVSSIQYLCTTGLPLESQPSKSILDVAINESVNTSEHREGLSRNAKGNPSDLQSCRNLYVESPEDASRTLKVQVQEPSSEIVSEVPLKFQSSKNISEIAPSYSPHTELDLQSLKNDGESSVSLDSNKSAFEGKTELQVFTDSNSVEESPEDIPLPEIKVSAIPSEVSLKFKPSENISEIASSHTSLAKIDSQPPKSGSEPYIKRNSTGGSYGAKVESQVFTDSVNQNPLSKMNSFINTLKIQLDSKNSESNSEVQMESKSSSNLGTELVSFKCASESPKKSGVRSPSLSKSHLVMDSSQMNSGFPNSTKNNAKLNSFDMIVGKGCDNFQSSVNHQVEGLQSCQSKPAEFSEALKPSELTPNLRKRNPPKIKGRKQRTKDESESRKMVSFKINSPKTNSCENLAEFRYAFRHPKQKRPTKLKSEVKVDLKSSKEVLSQVLTVLPSSEPNLTPERLVLMTHELNDSVTDKNSVVFVKPEEGSTEFNLSMNDSEDHSAVDTRNASDKSQVNSPNEAPDGCSENLSHSNKPEKLNTTLTMADENKLPIEFKSISNDDSDPSTLGSKFSCIKIQEKNMEQVKSKDNKCCVSSGFNISNSDWYKICKTDCSTCHNSATLTVKHKIMMNDSIDVCFYCKGRINNIPIDTNSCDSIICSCQNSKSNISANYLSIKQHQRDFCPKIFIDSKLSRENTHCEINLNSNSKNNKISKKLKSPLQDHLNIDSLQDEELGGHADGKKSDCDITIDLNSFEENSSNLCDGLSVKKRNTPTGLEPNPIQSVPGLVGNSLCKSKVVESDTPPSVNKHRRHGDDKKKPEYNNIVDFKKLNSFEENSSNLCDVSSVKKREKLTESEPNTIPSVPGFVENSLCKSKVVESDTQTSENKEGHADDKKESECYVTPHLKKLNLLNLCAENCSDFGDVLSVEKRNTTESEPNPIQSIPGFVENSSCKSKVVENDTQPSENKDGHANKKESRCDITSDFKKSYSFDGNSLNLSHVLSGELINMTDLEPNPTPSIPGFVENGTQSYENKDKHADKKESGSDVTSDVLSVKKRDTLTESELNPTPSIPGFVENGTQSYENKDRHTDKEESGSDVTSDVLSVKKRDTLTESELNPTPSIPGFAKNSSCKSKVVENGTQPSENKDRHADKKESGCDNTSDFNKLYSFEENSLNLSDVLSGESRNRSDSEANPTPSIPGFVKNNLYKSKVVECDTQTSENKDNKISEIKLLASDNIDVSTQNENNDEFINNGNNDVSTPTFNKSIIRRTCDEFYDERVLGSRCYNNDVFQVSIILKEVPSDDNYTTSLMSHVETFWIHNRKRLRELLTTRYFSKNDKKLVIYTDVCGFRYTRLFTENIPKKTEYRVIFESGGNISYYLQKVINCHKTEKVISPQVVLIVYGNSLIPDKNVFHWLQLASNLSNIKLIVTTVPSQKPRIVQFNRKMIYYSKRYGYYVWDINKIHFLTDNVER